MEIREYGALFLRRKWWVVFSFISVLVVASAYFVLTPKLYRSSITILIIPQTVPQDYVRSTVSFRVEQQLGTIKQQVMSRTALTRMMEELELFDKERMKLTAEELFDLIRKRIEIDVVRGHSRDSNEAFSLSFLHEDPHSAKLGAARLASLFIGENLKTREQQAVGTSEFLDSQLKETKAKLELVEQRVKDYKMRHMGELPQQMDANLRMLSGLQDRLRTIESSVRAAEERKVFLDAQIGLIGKASASTVGGENGRSAATLDPVQSLVQELALARERLADLSSRYTDMVPEVVRAKRGVAELESRLAATLRLESAPVSGAQGLESVSSVASSADVGEVRRMKAQLKSAAAEIASLRHERDEIRKGIAAVELKIDRSPRREQEMISLIRDYENQKKSYDDLLQKKLEADVSQNLEKRQKGTQFQILDPANLPEEPFQPNRWKVIGVSLMLALSLGFGGALAWESFDLCLRSVRDFRHLYKVHVLGYIPLYRDPRVERERRLHCTLVYGGLIALSLIFSIILLTFRERIRSILSF